MVTIIKPGITRPILSVTYACTLGLTIDAPEDWHSGDVVCVDDQSLSGISLSNLNFNPPVRIRTTNNTQLVKTGLTGTSFALNNCHGLIIEGGFDCFGGLYGFRAIDCSRIQLDDLIARDVGQEAVTFRPETPGSYDSFIMNRVVVSNTGLNAAPSQFGEGIYVGNGDVGSVDLYSMTNVIINDVSIDGTTAEAIEFKDQVRSWQINGGTITNVDLLFNGAVTFATNSSIPDASTGLIDGLTVSNVSNRSASSHFHVALGHGDVTIRNCDFDGDNENLEYAIASFTTYGNQSSNTVTVENNNSYGDLKSENRIAINKFDGGTGDTDDAIFIFPEGVPYFWLDASDAASISETSGSVTEWLDKSERGFIASQATGAKQPTTGTRTINGLNAIDFDGSSDTMTILGGPQYLLGAMFFVVVDVDSTAGIQRIVSFQDNTGTRVSAGVEVSGNAYFNASGTYSPAESTLATGVALIAGYRDGVDQYVESQGNTGTDNSGTIIDSLDGWYIGAYNDGASRWFDGAIGEIKTYNYYDATDFAAFKAAIGLKWGI